MEVEELKSELSRQLDEINILWEQVTKRLKCVPLQDDATVPMDIPGEPGMELGIIKLDGKWKICAGSDTGGWQPVTERRIRIRVDSVKYIRALFDEVQRSGQQLLDEANAAIVEMEKFLE